MANENAPDEEKERIITEFSDKICEVLCEFEEKMPEAAMAALLIHHAKVSLCQSADAHCYYHMLGVLNEMMFDGIRGIWERINPNTTESDKEGGEDGDTCTV